MAIYHLSVKTISRSAGRSATAAAAYRAGVKIVDERDGSIHDYTRRGGVESSTLVLPEGAPEWASDRSALWNAAEKAETRKNSTVAREFEIALPSELSAAECERLALDLTREIVKRHGCAAEVSVHEPGKEGDQRNRHAHILTSTRRLGPDGFGEKTRELDDKKTGAALVTEWRERFAVLQNERLQEAGVSARVDHRTLEAQGIDREPTKHLGPGATGFERRTGMPSRRRTDFDADAVAKLAHAKRLADLDRADKLLDRHIIDLSADLTAAKAERAAQAQARARTPPPSPALFGNLNSTLNRLNERRSGQSAPSFAAPAAPPTAAPAASQQTQQQTPQQTQQTPRRWTGAIGEAMNKFNDRNAAAAAAAAKAAPPEIDQTGNVAAAKAARDFAQQTTDRLKTEQAAKAFAEATRLRLLEQQREAELERQRQAQINRPKSPGMGR